MMDLRLCNAKQRINTFVAKTRLGRHFQLEDSGHQNSRQGARFLTEVNAGLATFFAMVSTQPECQLDMANLALGIYHQCEFSNRVT